MGGWCGPMLIPSTGLHSACWVRQMWEGARPFRQLVKTSISDGTVQNAAQAVMDAISVAVVAEYHRSGQDPWSGNYWNLDGAHGIAIYFPPQSASGGDPENNYSNEYEDYVDSTNWAFCIDTMWDELLVRYFETSGLPPTMWTNPGIPTMLEVKYQVFLPFVVRGR